MELIVISVCTAIVTTGIYNVVAPKVGSRELRKLKRENRRLTEKLRDE